MKCAGLVIGGGMTARSAVYALSLLGLDPIFLLNRVDDEIENLMALFPNLTKKRGLIYLKTPVDVERYLAKPDSPVVLMVVGAIRALTLYLSKITCFQFLVSISRTRHGRRTHDLFHSFDYF